MKKGNYGKKLKKNTENREKYQKNPENTEKNRTIQNNPDKSRTIQNNPVPNYLFRPPRRPPGGNQQLFRIPH